MPVAIVVVFKEIPGEEGVKVIPLSGRSSDRLYLGSIAGAAQSILERIAASREGSEKESAEKESAEKESAEKNSLADDDLSHRSRPRFSGCHQAFIFWLRH